MISRVSAAWRLLFIILLASALFAPAAARGQAAPKSADAALPHGEIQYLWPAGAPQAVGNEEQDRPHLEIFGGWGSGPHSAVIVCPGGSYRNLAYDKEGTRIAEWLNLRGVTAFVLTYRLKPRYDIPVAQLDGKRAMRWARSHAQQYNLDPKRIGMWGFSAGGHLVGMVGTHFDNGDPNAADPVERISDRPDFVIDSYGVLSLNPDVAQSGAIKAVLGNHPDPKARKDYAPDENVTAQTPPFFLYATTTDPTVPVLSSVAFYTALEKAGVPAELHIFEQGPHGTGLAQEYPALSAWPDLLENWLRLNGWIPQRNAK